jgi:hypothetical protein
MSVLLRLAFLCCLSSALAQTMEFAGVYVTGMTVIGRPGPDSSCPPIVWIVTPNTPAAEAGIKPKPAAMTLVIDRDGIPMTFVFEFGPGVGGGGGKSQANVQRSNDSLCNPTSLFALL